MHIWNDSKVFQINKQQTQNNELKAYLHKCSTCARFPKSLESQLMSSLPAERVNRNRAFLVTSIDIDWKNIKVKPASANVG